MRRVLTFDCEGDQLVGTLDGAMGETGVLIVTGGRQTRIGPHRLMATLARDLAASGISTFRFDRRGVGDSGGNDPGYLGSAPDIHAALVAFTAACPSLRRVWGLGLCDGATALALYGAAVGLEGLMLLNPWVVSAEPNRPPPAAVRAHYRYRLLRPEDWRRLVTGDFNPKSLVNGLRTAFSRSDQRLANDVMSSFSTFTGPIHILLASQDATAQAFLAQYRGAAGRKAAKQPNIRLALRDSGSHSFASTADMEWLTAHIRTAIVG